jgi:antitoxin component YwqK of YwqJK toxin-antitoxin module
VPDNKINPSIHDLKGAGLIDSAAQNVDVNSEYTNIRFDSSSQLNVVSWPNKKLSMLLYRTDDSSGVEISFNAEGIIISHIQCKIVDKTFVEDGMAYYYNDAGKLIHSYTYKAGSFNGLYMAYDETGSMTEKGTYKNGEEFGDWFYYDKNGRVLKTVHY